MKTLFGLAVGLLGLSCSNASEVKVHRADFGEKWPLVVDEGTVTCRAPKAAIFRAPDGKEYALNGIAGNLGYASLRPIQATNAVLSRVAKTTIYQDATPLIDRALTVCP